MPRPDRKNECEAVMPQVDLPTSPYAYQEEDNDNGTALPVASADSPNTPIQSLKNLKL